MYIRRRNAEPIRVKRQSKGCKRTEAIIASSVFQYLQIVLIWIVVIAFDMLLDLRLEFIWPCWLLIRSTHDTYRSSGLLFALFFLTVALASDIVVYLFLPLNWILFIGSSFVWLQLAFQTERGICLPTIALCLVFLYVEFAVRFRDHSKMFPVINQILRPLAAHCIGYPIVTIGFHIKAFVSGKMAQRNKLRVRECNHFYFDLVDQALPEELRRRRTVYNENHVANGRSSTYINGFVNGNQNGEEEFSDRVNGGGGGTSSAIVATSHTSANSNHNYSPSRSNNKITPSIPSGGGYSSESNVERKTNNNNDITTTTSSTRGLKPPFSFTHNLPSSCTTDSWCNSICPTSASDNSSIGTNNSTNPSPIFPSSNNLSSLPVHSNCSTNYNSRELQQQIAHNNSLTMNGSVTPEIHRNNGLVNSSSNCGNASGLTTTTTTSTNKSKSKDENTFKLESENKRLKGELQTSRSSENDLRSQVQQFNAQERATATEMQRLRQENENIQSRVHSLTNRLNEERNKYQLLEKKLTDEKRAKTTVEVQLEKEKKCRKEEVEAAKQLVQQVNAQMASAKNECSDSCKQKRKENENEMKNLRRECRTKDERISSLEQELDNLRNIANVHNDLVISRDSLRDQQKHLSEKLREENKFKQDLLTAYHEATKEKNRHETKIRQLEMDNMQLRSFLNSLLNNPPSPSMQQPQYGYNGNGSIARSNSNLSCLGSLSSPSPPPAMSGIMQQQQQHCGNGINTSDANHQLSYFSSQSVSTSMLEMPPTPTSPSMSSCISPASLFAGGSCENGFLTNSGLYTNNTYAPGSLCSTVGGGGGGGGNGGSGVGSAGNLVNNQLQSYSMAASTSTSTPSSMAIISTVGINMSNNSDMQ